jgi:hypothetical protein
VAAPNGVTALQFATRFFERRARQPPRRSGFGTWALAAQLSVRSRWADERLWRKIVTFDDRSYRGVN